ncbi:MAG: transposase family protein [Rhodobacter sp.]|nr:transposase family protein [Rhodobacter sp.]
MSRPSLPGHFSALDDPRQRGKGVYPLPEIMLLVFCATLAGAEDFVEIHRWGRQKLKYLRSHLPFAQGIPSLDRLNDVMNALDGGLFSIKTILARGARCLFAPKDNRRSLAEVVALFLDTPGQRSLVPFKTTDADHGRIGNRRHRVSHDVAWLNGDRRAPGERRFPGLVAIAMAGAEVEAGGKTTIARRFFLSSLPLDAPQDLAADGGAQDHAMRQGGTETRFGVQSGADTGAAHLQVMGDAPLLDAVGGARDDPARHVAAPVALFRRKERPGDITRHDARSAQGGHEAKVEVDAGSGRPVAAKRRQRIVVPVMEPPVRVAIVKAPAPRAGDAARRGAKA